MRGVREALRRSAVEGKLRCERKAGAFLAGVQKHKGGRPGKTGNGVLPVLDDHGVSKMQSSRWQRLASIPDDEFDATRRPQSRRRRPQAASNRWGATPRGRGADRASNPTGGAGVPLGTTSDG